MGLRFRFNLVLTLVFLLGLLVSGYVSYDLLQRNARDAVVRNANLMIESARAIRSYIFLDGLNHGRAKIGKFFNKFGSRAFRKA